MKHHFRLTWDTENGRDSKHFFGTLDAAEREIARLYTDNRDSGTPIWNMSCSRVDNPGAADTHDFDVQFIYDDCKGESYRFTGTDADLNAELDWLRANGCKGIYANFVEPEPPKLHTERIKVVRAMETIARAVNDESAFDLWLSTGVADGDIDEDTADEELEDYCDDETFADLMDAFLKLMARAKKSGGLYCDGITSGEAE